MYEVVDVSARTDPRVTGDMGSTKRQGIMLHTTDGVSSLRYLQGGSINDGRYASADYLIERNGRINALMPRGKHAYHAGVCKWLGLVDERNLVSKLLIGVEIENHDSRGQAPTVDQHRSCAGLVLVLSALALPSVLRCFGHYGLAHPMGRRSDPQGWDWGYMFWLMAHAKETIQLYGDVETLGGI